MGLWPQDVAKEVQIGNHKTLCHQDVSAAQEQWGKGEGISILGDFQELAWEVQSWFDLVLVTSLHKQEPDWRPLFLPFYDSRKKKKNHPRAIYFMT